MKQSIGSGRGSVYNIIMKALQSGDKYGYEICQEIEQKTNGNYILKQPSLYSGLKRLEAQKLVESYWGDSEIGGRRHYYRLTEQGKKKIEQTNFSWEDERNDLVDSMFQKSELDKNIDDIKADLDKAQSSLLDAQNTNNELNQTINSPASISENKFFGHKVNQNQYDLFSYAETKNTPSKQESELSQNTQQSVEVQSEAKQSETEQIQVEVVQSTIIDMQVEAEQPQNVVGEKLSGKINFESFMNDSQTSFYENKEEKSSSPISLEDLEKSSNFMGSFNNSNEHEQIAGKDDFDELYAKFQKSLEEEKMQEKAKSSKINSEQDLLEQTRLEQERRMSEALSGNLNNSVDQNLHQVETHQASEITRISPLNSREQQASEQINTQNEQSSLRQVNDKNTNLQEDLGFSKDFVDEFNSINFKSIFGDVYDDSDKQNQFNFNRENAQEETEIVRKNVQPVRDYSDNINLSLDSSKISSTKAYNPEQNSNYRTFEQNYYGKIDLQSDIQSQSINSNFMPASNKNLSFDQKCASNGYNFNDYEIRYLRKNVPEIRTTKFTRISKLHFTSSLIISFVAFALILTLSLVSSSKFLSTNTQKLFMYANIAVVGLFLLIQTLKYSSSRTKRVIYKFETKYLLLNIVISLAIFSVVFLINNFSGMTIHNIKNYCFSFIIPCCLLVLYVFLPVLNKIFSKLPYYAK